MVTLHSLVDIHGSQAAKDASDSHNKLIDLFNHIEHSSAGLRFTLVLRRQRYDGYSHRDYGRGTNHPCDRHEGSETWAIE